MRPLDALPSLKLKLGVLIAGAVVISATVSTAGVRLGVPIWLGPVVACALALLAVQVFARGMTAPLRQMVAAAERMQQGRYDERVHTASRDEVGQLAEAFNDMAAQVGEVDRLRRDLVANAAHELRTPIAGLQAALENLLDGVTDPDPATLTAMHDQVRRLGDLVEQLLDLSRLESGTAPLQLGEADLIDIARTVVRDLRQLAARHDVRVAVDVDGDMPDTIVRGDVTRLHQVGLNLLANAIRHSPPEGLVHVGVAPTPLGARLTVTDDGPGIPAHEAELVFERFYRADAARRSGEGAGLGLAICRWIVELHGGRIAVDTSGPGCRMVVELPRHGPQEG